MQDKLRRYIVLAAIVLVYMFQGTVKCSGADDEQDIPRLLKEARDVLSRDPKKASSLASRALKLCDTAHPDSITIAFVSFCISMLMPFGCSLFECAE